MTNYSLIFTAALMLNLSFTYRSSDLYKRTFGRHDETKAVENGEDEAEKGKWKRLRRKYLSVYLLATLADWLQGPYVYALYADYGYSQHEIALLFVSAFGSSMIFGSFVGGMADWGGRRFFVILFTFVYASSCITKHFRHFGILMLGRLFGGIATSLLFSVFEAWLIRSHTDAGIKHYLGKSFSWAAYGNSIVAITAGLIANRVASEGHTTELRNGFYIGGFLNPFDIALCSLLLCGFRAATTWEENYGDTGASADGGRTNHWHDGLKNAFQTTIRSTDILLCGLISSLFEGSMYVFVFMWTPALTENEDTQLPFGLIFSTFMVCCMAGSSAYSILSDTWKGEQIAVGLFATASCSMLTIAASRNPTIKFIAMNVFEMSVGMYFPIMGTMKGTIVPESVRAAIYSLFRIPLNFIVLTSLLTDLEPSQSFALNFLMLAMATGLQVVLMKRRELHGMTQGGGIAPTLSSSKQDHGVNGSSSDKDRIEDDLL